MLASIQKGIHFVENAARIPSYIPAVSTVTGATRAVSSLTLAVASLACVFFHQVNALHASVTSSEQKKIVCIRLRDNAVNCLRSSIIGVCRGVLEALPIIGNLAAYAIDSYATQKKMAALINVFSGACEDLQSGYDSKNEELTTANQKNQELLSQIENLKQEYTFKDKELTTAMQRNQELSSQIENLQQEYTTLQTTDKKKEEEITRLSRQVENLLNQKEQAEKANETLRLAKTSAEEEARQANLKYNLESKKVQELTKELEKVKVLEQEKERLTQQFDSLSKSNIPNQHTIGFRF